MANTLTKSSALTWFELPVGEYSRAVRFYTNVLDVALHETLFGGSPIAVFPYDRERGIGGCLDATSASRPSEQGAIVYLAVDDLDAVLARVVANGGRIVLDKVPLADGEMGHLAQMVDSEGNRVGLHQMS